MSRFRLPLLLVALAVLPRPGWSEEAPADGLRPLCAARPGKATPPCIVDAGHLQFETAVVDWTRAPGGGGDTTAVAGFEARYGVNARSEVELAWTPLSISHANGARQVGVGDLTFGARTSLTAPGRSGVAVSVEPFVTAPTGTHGQGLGQWGGGVLLPVAIPLGSLALAFTPALQSAPAADRPGLRTQVSAALGASYGAGPISVGAEFWGASQPAVRGSEQASADVFVAWTPARLHDVQFDAGVNAGLTRNTPPVELSLGVAHRF